MVKKPIFLHIRKKVRFFLVLNTFFIIPNITFAESKIYWNAQTDVFSIQSMSTIREVLDCIEANSDYIFVYSDEVNSRLSNKVSISTLHIPADTRSAFPVISVQSPVSIQCCWQS